jgi:RRXRR protein
MPCKPSKARKLLKEGKARVIRTIPFTLTMSHYQMKTSSLDHIKPNTLFAAKSMTANGVTV